jgi:hypothetical protein
MPEHDYTAREALELLIRQIQSASPELALRIQLAVDEGKEAQMAAEESGISRGRRPTKTYYRKNVPLTDEEALTVAITVLESHLIESRKVVNATHDEFTQVGLAPPKQRNAIESSRELSLDGGMGRLEPKAIEIEIEPETVQEKRNLQNLKLEPMNDNQVHGLQEIFIALKSLTNFG